MIFKLLLYRALALCLSFLFFTYCLLWQEDLERNSYQMMIARTNDRICMSFFVLTELSKWFNHNLLYGYGVLLGIGKSDKSGIFLCKPTYIRVRTNFFKEMFYYSKFVHMYGKENKIYFLHENKLFLEFIWIRGVIYLCQHMK